MEAESVDLTVTSPPYDNLRTYNGYCFDFENIAKELYRVTKQGGVVVWVVGDATIDGDETGTSFRQALYFKEIGFKLFDTMIYQKPPLGAVGNNTTYWQAFEYMFVFSKGKPKTINLICDGEGNAEPCFDAPHLDGEYNFAANGYTKGNGDMACNVMICDDAVISVGSYITTTNWKGYQGRDKDYPESPLTGNKQVIGEISDFSSYCVDDNGKPRPTLLAPGQGIISAASNWDKGLFKITDEGNGSQPGVPDEGNKDKEIALDDLISYVDKHGRRNWYVLEQGTSMATPHAAGIVTLWMQAKPTLTVNEIKEIMKETCVNELLSKQILPLL